MHNAKLSVSVLLAMALSWLLPSAEADTPMSDVKWVGSLRDVHHGIDYSGHIDLMNLTNLPHLYAVGPAEGLKGEVTIWDSTALLSEIDGCGNVVISDAFARKASVLVYGQVSDWQAVAIKDAISDNSISNQIQALAQANGVATDKPFVFLVKGRAKKALFHVLNKTDGLSPDGTTQQHEKAKVKFQLSDQPVEILGFYSEHHKGVFTRRDSFVHLHLKTPDSKQAGHLETFELEPGSTVYLPRKPV
jgi:acetolactate decarboxylase